MYQRMYIDIVFMTNFLMDYMLLRLVGKFLHLDGKDVYKRQVLIHIHTFLLAN